MNLFRAIKKIAKNTETTNELLSEMNEKFAQLLELQKAQHNDVDLAKQAMASQPLLIAEKTYNTSHPEYDAHKVRNYPGRLFNAQRPCQNTVYQALQRLMKKKGKITEIPDFVWHSILEETTKEIHEIPESAEIFEKKRYIENYIADLSDSYQAHYMPGWVNLDDALFLYWIVRRLKPKTIVQTGVCNGLSSAFMMLALAKNGPDSKLYVIDLPPIFDPNDPAWRVKNQVYGVVIPEGKSSGWMVPEAYRDRFIVAVGDAKQCLPPLVDKLDSIDLFYHDSDHTYEHMMFEFNEVKRKLSPGGLIVGDDISWNESVWDFADQHQVPSYNYKGAVGVAFL